MMALRSGPCNILGQKPMSCAMERHMLIVKNPSYMNGPMQVPAPTTFHAAVGQLKLPDNMGAFA